MEFENLVERLKPIGLGHKILLGVGPMSRNVVDAILDMVNVLGCPLQLVASRRQIESEQLGGGYVNGWTTESFANYVRENDKRGNVILCRDHGGPWQGTGEEDLPHAEALKRAMHSYEYDIRAGFNVIHIDPSLKRKSLKAVKDDIEKLVEHCEGIEGAEKIVYECGSEETNGCITDPKDFASFAEFCAKLSPKIKFLVGQTGTLVKEMRNVGKYDGTKARELVSVCNRHGMYLKEHNLDYATDLVLKDHRSAGIHSANIAPEMGVLETTRFLEMLQRYKMKKERKRFIDLAVASNKWEKWVTNKSCSEEDKAKIAGHYIFNNEEVQEIYTELDNKTHLTEVIKAEISSRLLTYMRYFRWVV